MTDTRVTRVLKTTSTKNQLIIRTVEIRAPNPAKSVLLTASKEVILAAGVIGTPHILLNSGIGDQNDLRALKIPTVLHNPSVGRNLSDHPLIRVFFGFTPRSNDMGPWKNLTIDPVLQAEALQVWKDNRTGPYVAFVPGNHILWTRLPDDSPIFKSQTRLLDSRLLTTSGYWDLMVFYLLGISP